MSVLSFLIHQYHNIAALLLYTGIKEQKYVVFIEYFIQY